MGIIPTLRYSDADRAIAFLTDAFGFTEESVVRGDGGQVAHAELSWDGGVVMVGSRRPGDVFDTGKAVTYVVVDDPDAHCARARAAGAEIVQEPVDQPYGSREYSARDPEGNIWSFGTYRPQVTTGPR